MMHVYSKSIRKLALVTWKERETEKERDEYPMLGMNEEPHTAEARQDEVAAVQVD